MTWDLWVDFMRTDGEGLTHASLRNARPGLEIMPDDHVIVGNEEAQPAVARVHAVADDGIVLLSVLPGDVEEHRHLLRPESAST